MSIHKDQPADVPQLLNRLKNTFKEETSQDDYSSAKDVKKMIGRLMNEFRSIGDKLNQIKEPLPQVADPDKWNIIDNVHENLLVKRLRVSYEFFHQQLEHDPRICLFLAIFPENAVLRKRFLIYWWIGEGLVQDEKEGERVFEELLDLHLLLPYRTDKCPRVSKCRIFPWIRYMLISVAIKEKLLKFDDENVPRFDPAYSQRTCLIASHTKLASDLSELSQVETLRTIININVRDVDFQHQWLAKLKRLAVLQLGRWQVSPIHHIEVIDESFLTGLKTQKHLKYLSLRGISRITSLPDFIKELVSLQILDLKACHNLESLPAAIASLRKLTHLEVSECYLLDRLPKGLDKLTSLQVLKGFIVGHSEKRPITFEHLGNLKRLSIHVGGESDATTLKEEFDKLKDLKELKCLKISWGEAVENDYIVSFPSKLQKLDLEGIPHKEPAWLSPSKLGSLETLCIKGGKLENLVDKGERWNNVKYLVLKYTKMPQINQETLKSLFPSLQYVKKVEWEKNGQQEYVEFEWNKG